MQRAQRTRGFTLIEVALAIVVVGVGVLALYSLISTGMDMSAKAVADTQGAMFAEAAFNGFRSASTEAAQQSTSNNVWASYWSSVQGGTATNLVAAPAHWVGGNQNPPVIRILADGQPHLLTFVNAPQHGSTTVSGIENFTLKYKFVVASRGAGNWPTYVMSLLIWPGRYNKQPPNVNDALRFYTEFPFAGSL